MKRVLVIHYSQSGQLNRVVQSVVAPLESDSEIAVTFAELKPLQPYPFPWPFWRFFDTFPEAVYEDVPPLEIDGLDAADSYDLIILAYQVWFLSPSLPVTAFLKSEQAMKLLKGKPVVTVIACRNMWLMAQEKVKNKISSLGASLVDNVVLTDACGSALSFFATPLWVLTGNKGPYWFGVPAAGVAEEDIVAAERFGNAISSKIHAEKIIEPMLTGLGAVVVNHRLIASEKIAHRSFRIWGGLLRFLGKPGSPIRRLVLSLYIVFLIILILTVVPISAIIKRSLEPLLADKINKQREYYAWPSGDSRESL